MKQSINGKSRFGRFLRNNAVYVTLAIALVAVGALGVSRVLNMPAVDSDNKRAEHEMVEQKITDQPDERTTTTTTSTASASTTTQTTEEEEAPDLYVLPLSNTVQKAFSAQTPLYSETMKHWRVHLGADFAGEEGQEVKAVARGTVTAVEKDPLWGDVVEIDHSMGVVSRYCGVKASVKKGDKVDVAQGIGTLTEVPCESAQKAHLHLEMLVDDVPVNPVEAIALEVRYADTLEEEETDE